jgi:hypothetical protein
MENITALNNTYSKNGETYENKDSVSSEKPSFNPLNFGLTAEGGKNFFRYLKSFNLSQEPDIMILPPNQHYYYDETDLKNVRTLINLKKLNLIKDLDTFLNNLISLLPSDANFIGCFSDSKSHKKNRLLSGLSSRFINFIDLKTDHIIGKNDISNLLEKYGFKLVDMTEMNGLTFFYTQIPHQPVEIRA